MGILTAENITCIRSRTPVFSGLSLTVAAGETLVVTGANGSGKTSLLRLIAGLIAPAKGTIFWDNIAIQRQRGYCHFSSLATPLKPDLTVAENLSFWKDILRLQSGKHDVIPQALAFWQLEKLAKTPLRYLSAGQTRRVNLCRLQLSERPLWLLDEPETGLDAHNREQLIALINQHTAAGGSAVIASHNAALWPRAKTLDLTGGV